MTSQLAMEVVEDGGVLSGQDREAVVEHDPVGGLVKVFVHESCGSAALCGREPDVAEHLGHVPLHGVLVDPRHGTQQQPDVGLQERRLGAAYLLESVAGAHPYDLVIAFENAPDQLVETLGFCQGDFDYLVDVAQRSRIATAQPIMDRLSGGSRARLVGCAGHVPSLPR